MTMRTYYYFQCPNGHQGAEKISENDQPYSKMWESVTLTGMSKHSDSQGKFFVCNERGQRMASAPKPASA